MTKFMKHHKVLTAFLAIVIVIIFAFVFAGRSICNFAAEQIFTIKSNGKAYCTINPQNATQFVYKGTTYQILNETVSSSGLGRWEGYSHLIAILDSNFRVLKQVKSGADSVSQMKELMKDLPKSAKYMITFYNVFSVTGVSDKQEVAIDLFGGTYKAVPADRLSSGDMPIKYDMDTCSALTPRLNAIK